MARPSFRRLLYLAALILGGVSLIWMRAIRPFERPSHEHATPAPLPSSTSASGSPLAAELNLPDGTPGRDLAALHAILGQFTTTFTIAQLPPLGDNEDITAALTGHNRRHLVFIPPDSPVIDDHGRLIDRWGTPYFFHARSAEVIDVRSAGPDRRLFTADDVTKF